MKIFLEVCDTHADDLCVEDILHQPMLHLNNKRLAHGLSQCLPCRSTWCFCRLGTFLPRVWGCAEIRLVPASPQSSLIRRPPSMRCSFIGSLSVFETPLPRSWVLFNNVIAASPEVNHGLIVPWIVCARIHERAAGARLPERTHKRTNALMPTRREAHVYMCARARARTDGYSMQYIVMA